MLCISIKSLQLLPKAAQKGDLVELRLDGGSWPLQKLPHCAVPLLLTLRSREHGGAFSGTQEEMEQRLEQLAALGPAYLDVEYGTRREFIAALQKRYPAVKLILSYHGPFDKRVWEEMQKVPVALYKMAVEVNSTVDAFELLLFSKQAGSQLIVQGMGEYGQVTRILGPCVQNFWTYASLDETVATASGQLSADQLSTLYRYRKLSAKTALVGLIGTTTYSIGNRVHNAVYDALGIDAVYVPLTVSKEEVGACLQLAEALGFLGLSVTMPLKECVQPYLCSLTSHAKAIGAVNTLAFSSKGIEGSNSDAAAALDALEGQQLVAEKRLMILGAGGAARAVAYEGRRRGAEVTLVGRNRARAEKVAEELGVKSASLGVCDFLINATASKMPISADLIPKGIVVMDLKTIPKMTPFLRAAQERGCRLVFGQEMFVRQAVGQLTRWFGLDQKLLFQAVSEAVV